MIDTQLLNDALMTVAFSGGLVVAISAWVVAAPALHQRHTRAAQIRPVEQHLADVAGQTPAPTRESPARAGPPLKSLTRTAPNVSWWAPCCSSGTAGSPPPYCGGRRELRGGRAGGL